MSLKVYMYTLEKHLLSKKNEFLKISFKLDEANTDRSLKEYLKHEIETNFSSIPKTINIDTITSNNSAYPVKYLQEIKIKSVLLPEEITNEIKQMIKETKQSIYTNPDLCFLLKIDNHYSYVPIELKSTKVDSIPGSSIQQIVPDEWVIFIKHSKISIDIVTGKYINAINTKIPFPDRSPRPQVSFKSLSNWNKNNRIINNNNLEFYDDSDLELRKEIIFDWQTVLSNRWIDIIFNSKYIKTKEPWFNNNLRKFIISFLNKYEALSIEEKEKLKNDIKNLIKE